jgi:hypothetical protein
LNAVAVSRGGVEETDAAAIDTGAVAEDSKAGACPNRALFVLVTLLPGSIVPAIQGIMNVAHDPTPGGDYDGKLISDGDKRSTSSVMSCSRDVRTNSSRA